MTIYLGALPGANFHEAVVGMERMPASTSALSTAPMKCDLLLRPASLPTYARILVIPTPFLARGLMPAATMALWTALR